MTMVDLAFRSAVELAAEIRAKRIGCRELLEHYLTRVERFNPGLNAIVVTQLDTARTRADAADAALAKDELWGPLHGVPMTVKESYDVAGLPTTWGLPALKDTKASGNALAVDRMLGAGAVIFGKTNVPVLLADGQAYNEIYGSTSNPWDLSRTPGGSSGGAAAALAAGLTGLEMGSDIASSVRNPAHFSGVYAHKPTWGICPPRGHALGGAVTPTDISVIGPLARSSRDLALALSIMAGPDDIDGAGWRLELPPPRKKRFADYRVAVMLSDPVSEVDQSVQDQIQNLADFLAKAGATVDDRARPAIDSAEVDKLFILLLRAASSGRQSPETLLRQHAARQHDLACRMARAQRAAPQAALGLARILQGLRHPAGAALQHAGPQARPGGRALAAPNHGQRQERAGDDPHVLGGLYRCVLPALDGAADRPDAGRAAGRRPDRRAAIRRSDVHRLRQDAGGPVSRLRAAAGV
jgi:amidase